MLIGAHGSTGKRLKKMCGKLKELYRSTPNSHSKKIVELKELWATVCWDVFHRIDRDREQFLPAWAGPETVDRN